MKKMKTMLVVCVLALMSFVFVSEDAFARSRGGGGSRSRSSYKAPAKTYKAPVKKVAPAPKKTWGSKPKTIAPSSRVTAKSKMTPAKQKSLETAKKNGTAFKSKDAASAAFKTKQAGKYPSKYATKPATRPDHIPQTTMVNGRSVTVVYNVERGSYGYGMGSAFSPYNSMSDLVMLSILMDRNHYVVQPVVAPRPVVVQRPVEVRNGSSVGKVVFWTVLVIALMIGGGIAIGKMSGKNKSTG